MNQFSEFQDEIDEALSQSVIELRRLAEFYRRHGKIEYANQVEQSLQKKPAKTSHFHWLRRPSKAS
jgi:hypothetical protein